MVMAAPLYPGLFACHSGARAQHANPESIPPAAEYDSGPAASRRPGMTGSEIAASHSFLPEHRLHAAAVELERALFADRIRPLEDPVLPRGQTAEDFGFHRLRTGKAQVRFHAGHRIGR